MAGPVVVSWGESPENLSSGGQSGRIYWSHERVLPGRRRWYRESTVLTTCTAVRSSAGGFFGLSVELRRPTSTPYGRSRERRPSELVGSGSEASRIGSGDQAAWNRASGRTGKRGGARVGKPRWVRILAITAGSSTAAMSFIGRKLPDRWPPRPPRGRGSPLASSRSFRGESETGRTT